jgi:hypothetical protein
VRNTALNDLRDSPPTPELLAEAIAGGESPAEELERREELADLMHRLQSLPEPQRAAIVMREMEGLSHEEIAAALGVSGGAARQAIHRARQALRNGAGMLVPLPLLKALLAAGSMGTAEVATAGAGGTVGTGLALKAVTATVLVAGAVGAGAAVHDGRSDRSQEPAPAGVISRETATRSAAAAPVAAIVDDRSGNSGEHRGRGESGSGDDHGGKGREPGDDHGSRQAESGDDRGSHDDGSGGEQASSGHGSGGSGDNSGRGSNSGSGGDGGSGGGRGGSGSSGSSQGGSSGHGGDSGSSGGSSHGGSGSGDDFATTEPTSSSGEPGPSGAPQPAPEESSGSGSGSGSSGGSGSGDGSESGGSGSGSGGDGDHIDG